MVARSIDITIRGRDEASAAFDSASKKAGLLEGSFHSVTVMGAMRLHTAMQSVETVMANVRGISALIRGDFEGMRKAADALPMGFGAVVKELAGPVDKAIKELWFYANKIQQKNEPPAWLRGLFPQADLFRRLFAGREIADPYGGGKAGMSREAIAQMSRDAKAVEQARAAFQKSVLSPRELAEQEASGMSPEARAQFLTYRMGEIGWKEKGAALKAEKDLREKGRQALMAAEQEYLKGGASPEERIRLEVSALGLEKDAAADVLKVRLETYRVEKDRADAAATFTEMEREATVEARARFDEVQAQVNEEMDAWQALFDAGERLTASLRMPLERLNDDMARYRELLDDGLISMETFRRAEARAKAGALPSASAGDINAEIRRRATAGPSEATIGLPIGVVLLRIEKVMLRSVSLQEQAMTKEEIRELKRLGPAVAVGGIV